MMQHIIVIVSLNQHKKTHRIQRKISFLKTNGVVLIIASKPQVCISPRSQASKTYFERTGTCFARRFVILKM